MKIAPDKIQLKFDDMSTLEVSCTIEANIPVKGRFALESKKIERERAFKIDTGATHTCMNAADLGINITEAEFKEWKNTEILDAYGINDDKKIVFYKLQVDNFKVGEMELGSVPIYVTFEECITKRLLGMNILRLLNMAISGDKKIVYIEKSNRLMNYQKTHLRIEKPEMLNITYGEVIKEEVISFNGNDLEVQVVDENGNELTDDELEELI